MSKIRTDLARLVACALMVAFVIAAPVLADPSDDARDLQKAALEAVESGDWASAERDLRQAVALDPMADKRTFAKDYLPHYWLGVVLQEQSRCRAALAEWDEARSQGVATDSRDGLDLPRRRKLCEDAVEKLETAVAEAQNAIERARRADGTLAELAGAPELAAHWAPFENRRQAALQSLVEAQRRLELADEDEDLDVVREVADTSSQVASRLHTIAADARAKAGQVSSASARAQSDLDEAEAEASSILRAVQPLEPLPPALEAQAVEVRRLLDEVDEIRRRGRPGDTRRHSRALAEAIRGLKNLAQPPPTWLAEAAQAYLDQDFAGALALVDQALGRPPDDAASEPDDPAEEEAEAAEIRVESDRERFHAHLLAAAARHQMWIAAGEDDVELRRLVGSDLAEAVDLATAGDAAAGDAAAGDIAAGDTAAADAAVPGRPSPRFLSPKLRALWVEAGGSPPVTETSDADATDASASDETSAADDGPTP